MTYVKQTWANGAGGGTPTSAARLQWIEDGLEAVDQALTALTANAGGAVLDHAEIGVTFDVMAVGTTATDIEGAQITVPASNTRPFIVYFHPGLVTFSMGSAASGSALRVEAYLYEVLANNTLSAVGFGGMGAVAGATASKTVTGDFMIERRFEPTGAARTFKVMAKLQAAAPAGWSGAWYYAEDTPTRGFANPMVMKAVAC